MLDLRQAGLVTSSTRNRHVIFVASLTEEPSFVRDFGHTLFQLRTTTMSGIVAIVGRPNVGKSTFNRLIEERQAIVDDMSGVTRDRNYGTAEWIGREFSVIDTGGYVSESDDVFESHTGASSYRY